MYHSLHIVKQTVIYQGWIQNDCKEVRAIIRANVKKVPGNPLARPNTLGRLFCQQELQRDLKLRCDETGFDAVHTLPGFDSEKDVRR